MPAKSKESFTDFIFSLSWESTLSIYLRGDSYYHYRADEGETASNAKPSLFTRLKRYLTRSSKTRLATHAFVGAYAVYTVASSGAQHAVQDGAGGGSVYYRSKDGLRLLLTEALPKAKTALHFVASMALMPLFLIQKENLFFMSYSGGSAGGAKDGAPSTNVEELKANSERARRSRGAHGVVGGLLNACTVVMAVSGAVVGRLNIFKENTDVAEASARHLPFRTAMALFAVPWLVLVPAVGITAVVGSVSVPVSQPKNSEAADAAATKRKTLRLCFPHMMAGNVLFKALTAVPLARLLGSGFQRIYGAVAGGIANYDAAAVIPNNGALESCYYAGIASSAVLVGVWAIKDIYCIIRVAQSEYQKRRGAPIPTAAV